MISINHHPSTRELRQFASIWFPAVFCVVGAWVWYATGSPVPAAVLLAPAVVVAVVGLCAPRLVRPIYVGWMYAVYPIGWTISHVIIAAVYYLLMTPIGLLLRVFGYDPLHRRLEPESESYWVSRNTTHDTKRYFRQF